MNIKKQSNDARHAPDDHQDTDSTMTGEGFQKKALEQGPNAFLTTFGLS